MIGETMRPICSDAASEERQISRGLTWATVAVIGIAVALWVVSPSTFPPATLLAGGFILGWTQMGST
jgi:hypothetical protein